MPCKDKIISENNKKTTSKKKKKTQYVFFDFSITFFIIFVKFSYTTKYFYKNYEKIIIHTLFIIVISWL